MNKTDGNLAALGGWQRVVDEAYEAERELEKAQHELADAMYDAYLSGNQDVIDEVDDSLTDEITWLQTLNIIREAMTTECERPVMVRGCVIYKAIERQLGNVCEAIAGRCDAMEKVEKFYGEFGL